MRSIITGLETNGTYTFRLGSDAVQSGLHACEYLGSVDGSIHPGQEIDPCFNTPSTAGSRACGRDPSLWPVPTDTETTFPRGSQAPGRPS
jgi:hypothetical protein